MEQETFFIIAALTLITVFIVKRFSNTDINETPKAVNREIQYLEDKWKDINKLLFSENNNDWRMAIIESDILIYNLMTFHGIQGDNHVEKINNLPSSFNKKQQLYNLHRTRNQIAHKGMAYNLDKEKVEAFKNRFEGVLDSFKVYVLA